MAEATLFSDPAARRRPAARRSGLLFGMPT
jgi:hypothetical protein